MLGGEFIEKKKTSKLPRRRLNTKAELLGRAEAEVRGGRRKVGGETPIISERVSRKINKRFDRKSGRLAK